MEGLEVKKLEMLPIEWGDSVDNPPHSAASKSLEIPSIGNKICSIMPIAKTVNNLLSIDGFFRFSNTE